MTRLPRLDGQAVLEVLRRGGYQLSHIRGSHHYLRKRNAPNLVVVPVHGNRIIPIGTMRSILRQAKLTTEEFEALYRQ